MLLVLYKECYWKFIKVVCKEFVKVGGNMELNLIGFIDLSKFELDRYSRKDINDEEKKIKLGDLKE